MTKVITSRVGKLDMMYEPPDPDGEGGKVKNFSMTEWFRVGRVDFHYNGMYTPTGNDDPKQAMITRADTERILASLTRL